MKTFLAWSNGLLIGYIIGVNRDAIKKAAAEQREKNEEVAP